MNQLLNQFSDEVQAILAKYPTGRQRSAVMPLLHLAQRQNGYITKQTFADIADILGISTTDVASIVGFYTLYTKMADGITSRSARTYPVHCAGRMNFCRSCVTTWASRWVRLPRMGWSRSRKSLAWPVAIGHPCSNCKVMASSSTTKTRLSTAPWS